MCSRCKPTGTLEEAHRRLKYHVILLAMFWQIKFSLIPRVPVVFVRAMRRLAFIENTKMYSVFGAALSQRTKLDIAFQTLERKHPKEKHAPLSEWNCRHVFTATKTSRRDSGSP